MHGVVVSVTTGHMATASQKYKLGVFLTVAAVLFVGTIVVFAGLTITEDLDTYYIYFEESVAGLELGAPVKLAGVNVGTVQSVRVNPENVEQVEVEIALEPNTPVKQDTHAYLNLQGITGLQYVELRDSTKDSPRLEVGGTIPAGESILAKFSGKADEMLAKVDKVLDNVLVLTGEDNQKKIASALTHVESMVRSIDKMSVELAEVVVEINRLLKENRGPIRRTINSVDDVAAKVEEMVGSANVLLVELRRAVDGVRLAETVNGINDTNMMIQGVFADVELGRTIENVTVTLGAMQLLLEQLTQMMGQNQEQLRAAMYNMRLATESIKEFSRSVERRPSLLIFDEDPEPRDLP
jgi:phospholipid/cholesterol/gamma-HCH transport system substrate-binding protein